MKLLTITIAACALSACAATPLTPSIEIESPSQVDRTEAEVPSGTEPPVTPSTPVPTTVLEVNDEYCYPQISDGAGGCMDRPGGGIPYFDPGLSDESCYPQISDGVNCVDRPPGGISVRD